MVEHPLSYGGLNSSSSPIFQFRFLCYTMCTSHIASGKQIDKFISLFPKNGREASGRQEEDKILLEYHMPDTVVIHHELRCTEHLSKCKWCPNTPEPIQKEASW
jgi:hypothetical protein